MHISALEAISICMRPCEHILCAKHYAPGKETQRVEGHGFGDALYVPPCVQRLSELKACWGHPGQVLWPTVRGKQDEGVLGGGRETASDQEQEEEWVGSG